MTLVLLGFVKPQFNDKPYPDRLKEIKNQSKRIIEYYSCKP